MQHHDDYLQYLVEPKAQIWAKSPDSQPETFPARMDTLPPGSAGMLLGFAQDDVEELVPDAVALRHDVDEALDGDELGLGHRVQGLEDVGQEAAAARGLGLEALDPLPVDADLE